MHPLEVSPLHAIHKKPMQKNQNKRHRSKWKDHEYNIRFIYPAIINIIIIICQGCREAEANLSWFWVTGSTPWAGRQTVTGLTHKDE